MAIESLQTFKDTLEALPKVADTSWANNFATWYSDQIQNIEPDSTILSAVGFTFTFNKTLFANNLITLPPTPDAVAGITAFATAWETAILASPVLCGPDTTLLPDTPATKFSVVAATIIDPASIALGKAKIIELASVDPSDPPVFADKFREATLLLTITVTGTNSVTPTPGPLVAPLVPLK